MLKVRRKKETKLNEKLTVALAGRQGHVSVAVGHGETMFQGACVWGCRALFEPHRRVAKLRRRDCQVTVDVGWPLRHCRGQSNGSRDEAVAERRHKGSTVFVSERAVQDEVASGIEGDEQIENIPKTE